MIISGKISKVLVNRTPKMIIHSKPDRNQLKHCAMSNSYWHFANSTSARDTTTLFCAAYGTERLFSLVCEVHAI